MGQLLNHSVRRVKHSEGINKHVFICNSDSDGFLQKLVSSLTSD